MIHDGKLSEWLHVKTGDTLLFLVVVDWVMKKATSDLPRGLVWRRTARLENADFAEDIGLLSQSQNGM